MDFGVWDSLGGAFPNKVYATLEMIIYSDSHVHGNRMLYAEARLYHYKLLLLNCWFRVCFLARRVEEVISEALIIAMLYNLLLYNVAATSSTLLSLLFY